MNTILVLAALAAAPQEQTPSQLVAAIHRDVDVAAQVAEIQQLVVATEDGEIAAVKTLELAQGLRALGIGALDGLDAVLPFGAQSSCIDDSLAAVRTAWGFSRPAEAPFRGDLDEFENVCSQAWRDLVQALGPGRELTRVAPELHAAIDQLRKSIENLDEIGGDEAERLTERLARASRVEQAVVHALAERILRAALALDRDEFRAAMRRQPVKSGRSDRAFRGDVLLDRDTAFGRMVVGGFGVNEYDCSQIDVIVDLGGDDRYRGPVAGAGERRRLAVVVDLDGDDVYEAGNDALGSGTFGIGILVDLRGADRYRAESRSGGFGLAGVGLLIDAAGDDQYEFGDLSGGVGFAGSGVFVDVAGDDVITAGVQALGCGLPGGLGLVVDGGGEDSRRLGMEQRHLADLVDESGRGQTSTGAEHQHVSAGFGAGIGAPPLLSGGLGVFIDLGDGSDDYHAGGLAHGVGIRGGVGLFRDAAGDDSYDCGDVAFGAAYANGVGLMSDDGGDDRYRASYNAFGAAFAISQAGFIDRSGDDSYIARGLAFGCAREAAVATFVDLGGTDRYQLGPAILLWRSVGIDVKPGGAAAVGLMVDLGGSDDQFEIPGENAPQNSRMRKRASAADDEAPWSWFAIDR